MEKKLDQLKKEYMDIPIPKELDFVVAKAIKKARKKKTPFKYYISAAVAAAIIFVSAINISPVVANGFSEIPVLNKIVKVLTFREYKIDENTYQANLKVPGIENLENKALEESLNAKYLQENEKLYNEFMADMEEMKKQGEGHLGVDSGFEVKTDNDRILSIARYTVNTVGSSSTVMKYDTIDKKKEILISLPSLFKDDRYVSVISENIIEQMKAKMKADPNAFFWFEGNEENIYFDGFKSIKKDQNFYINEDNKLVISFDKYEIAPGYMGVIDFVIPTKIIEDILVSDEYLK